MPIFDQGYQHWSGTLSGHTWRWLPITRHGVRTCGKSGRVLRIVLLVSWLPALALGVMLCLWGLFERESDLVALFEADARISWPAVVQLDPRQYRTEVWTLCFHYFLAAELTFSMILVLLVGPNLISQDLRYNALPLYFSRPLRRIDYFLGKLGVIVAFLGMVIIVPSLIAYALGLAFQPGYLDRARYVPDSCCQRRLRPGDRRLGRHAHPRTFVAIAQFAIHRAVVACHLDWLTGAVAGILTSADRHQREATGLAAAQGMGDQDYMADELEAARSDWRPLVSYTANLSRIGQQLLSTDAVWEKLSQVQPPNQRSLFVLRFNPIQYPLVLVGRRY